MRNPFVAMAMAAATVLQASRTRVLAAFNRGVFVEAAPPTSYAIKTGLTVAAAKRAATKTKNRAKHRAACRA